MTDKERRRQKRKAKRVKRPSANLKPLNLPGPREMNIYRTLKETVREDKAATNEQVAHGLPSDEALIEAIQQVVVTNTAEACLRACDRTLDHFQIPSHKREATGDMILRLGMVMAQQDQPVSISPDDPVLNTIFDWYEHYQKELDKEVSP